MTVGQQLPTLPIWLTPDLRVMLPLEPSYEERRGRADDRGQGCCSQSDHETVSRREGQQALHRGGFGFILHPGKLFPTTS
jgi:hypothetical protein